MNLDKTLGIICVLAGIGAFVVIVTLFFALRAAVLCIFRPRRKRQVHCQYLPLRIRVLNAGRDSQFSGPSHAKSLKTKAVPPDYATPVSEWQPNHLN